ncbi:MAG: hypothetical protein ACKV22_09765 [Bryobacteraceae bacterium]
MTNRKQPWEQRRGESSKAFAAFLAYRDLGKERSIDKCFVLQSSGKTAAARAPRHWFAWSQRFEWPERARAWDVHSERVQQAAFEQRVRELARQQAEFEVAEFQRLVRRVRQADAVLDRADAHPITDEEDETVDNGVTVRRKRKGINFAGYASLMKEIRESARQAIVGPRDSAGGGGAAAPVRQIVFGPPNFVVVGPDGTETITPPGEMSDKHLLRLADQAEEPKGER